MSRLELPSVTLCAATSVNVEATMAAIARSADQIVFGEVILFTDATPRNAPAGTRIVRIPRLRTGADYSNFVLGGLAPHVRTDHCLIVQWDGFVLNAAQWDASFLDFDYIGARWPQFDDGRDVGNGGFSLRSSRLLEACRSPEFVRSHPEDVAICRTNRFLLEERFGMRFANAGVAERFSFERAKGHGQAFGFHGVFNMILAVGEDEFWETYKTLDDRSAVWRDLPLLLRQLHGPDRLARRLGLVKDRAKHLLGRRTAANRLQP
jgi:hypothetical protein